MAGYDLSELPPGAFVPGGSLANPAAFALYYDDPKTPAFRAVARHWLESTGGGPFDRGMPTFLMPVGTVTDFVMAWRRLESLCHDEGFSFARGAVFGHGSHAGGTEQGLEFRPGGGTDSTLGPGDVMSLPPLTWGPTGLLTLANCASGLPIASAGETIADIFARRQRVTTIGQRGWSSFSLTWERHTEMQGHEATVYLWAYETGSNTVKGLGTLSKRRIPGHVALVR